MFRNAIWILLILAITCKLRVTASAINISIDCSDVQYCDGQFSDRGQRLCLAKELVNRLQSTALECPDLRRLDR